MEFNKNRYIPSKDINECTSRGACSIAPNISALQEIVKYFLRHMTHYIIELNKLGADNYKINIDIINTIASLVSVNEFSENQLYDLILNQYYLLKNIKDTYKKVCNEKNIKGLFLKNEIEFFQSTTVTQSITLGEKLFLKNYKKINSQERNLSEILFMIIKSAAINLSKITDFGNFEDEVYRNILNAIDIYNHQNCNSKTIKKYIEIISEKDAQLQIKICEFIFNKFGQISKTKISHSTNKGKAILVSGNNFFDLMKILEDTVDKNIDIYTHSNLLISHTLSNFKKYKNLKGHYGNNSENFILDFATFPGAILLTKNSQNTADYLYRGKLFSNDYITPSGVVKIENNDFTPVINSALNSKGFKTGKTKPYTIAGYDEMQLDNLINNLKNKFKNKKLSRLYIIGMNSFTESQKEYFKEFFENLNSDEFVISFSHTYNAENVETLNIGNYNPLAINIGNELFKNLSNLLDKITVFETTCSVMSFSNVIMLKNFGVKSIYMTSCPPFIVSPQIINTFINTYGIKLFNSPLQDLIDIRALN